MVVEVNASRNEAAGQRWRREIGDPDDRTVGSQCGCRVVAGCASGSLLLATTEVISRGVLYWISSFFYGI